MIEPACFVSTKDKYVGTLGAEPRYARCPMSPQSKTPPLNIPFVAFHVRRGSTATTAPSRVTRLHPLRRVHPGVVFLLSGSTVLYVCSGSCTRLRSMTLALLHTASRPTRCLHSRTCPPETAHVLSMLVPKHALIRASAGWRIPRGQYMREGGMRAVDPARASSHTRYEVIVSRNFSTRVVICYP